MHIIFSQESDLIKLDDEDAIWMTALAPWRLNAQGYAVRVVDYTGKTMHRLLLGEPPSPELEIDHINHDRLDNQRANLRWVTAAQNGQNKTRKIGTYLGVTFDEERNKFRAQIRAPYKINLGRFPTDVEAAQAYDLAAIEYYGEKATLNFPQESRAIYQFQQERKAYLIYKQRQT